MNSKILTEINELKEQTDFIINNRNILENKDIEKYLRFLEKTRYEIFNEIKLNNDKQIEEQDKIHCINNSYKAAYKNILLNTAEAVKDYKGLFKDKLTFVVIIVHEKQENMDIDNKYVKPIVDALVLQNIIQDDNINNMFYLALGKNDTKKPYTEVFVLDGKYILSWIEKLQKTI